MERENSFSSMRVSAYHGQEARIRSTHAKLVSFVPALCNTSIPEFLGRMPQHPGKRREQLPIFQRVLKNTKSQKKNISTHTHPGITIRHWFIISIIVLMNERREIKELTANRKDKRTG